MVFDSTGGFSYEFATHIVSGSVGAVSFGYGVANNSGSFQLSRLDLQISGLTSGNSANTILSEAIAGNIATLLNLLATNDVNFIGGAGNDTFVYDGRGADIVTDFQAGGDVIRVTGGYTTFAQIQANSTLVNGGADTRMVGCGRGRQEIGCAARDLYQRCPFAGHRLRFAVSTTFWSLGPVSERRASAGEMRAGASDADPSCITFVLRSHPLACNSLKSLILLLKKGLN